MPLVFLLVHVGIGLVAFQYRPIGTVQGVVAVLVCFFIAFTSPRIDRIVAAAGYLALCDVFWRMTRSVMPWEASKYCMIGILGIAFVRFVRRPQRIAVPIAFVALLLPACAVALVVLGPTLARDQVSTYMSGSVALCVAVVMFRQIKATEIEAQSLLWILLAPVLLVAANTARGSVEASFIEFSDNSNFASSGNFGPNQVSDLLALGALFCLLLALATRSQRRVGGRPRDLVLIVLLGAALAAQSALTFSRGGLYSDAFAILILVLAALATSGQRSRVVIGLVVIAVIGVGVYAQLDTYTDGSITARFTDTQTTGRNDIAYADIELFKREPLVGVGVGVATWERQTTDANYEGDVKAHTEYTRLLAEHGVLGLTAVVLLFAMAVPAVRGATSRWNRLLSAAFVGWALFTMTHSATNIAAIALVFGLAQLRLTADLRRAGLPPGSDAGLIQSRGSTPHRSRN